MARYGCFLPRKRRCPIIRISLNVLALLRKYLPSDVGKLHLSFYSGQRGCDEPGCRWWWWTTCHALWTPHTCTHPKPPAHQASTISSSHQLVASSRHQYGHQVALAQRPMLSASYNSITCIARVEGCTTTAWQARCYVLSSDYRMGSRHLCS
jgi:hypothetical protein